MEPATIAVELNKPEGLHHFRCIDRGHGSFGVGSRSGVCTGVCFTLNYIKLSLQILTHVAFESSAPRQPNLHPAPELGRRVSDPKDGCCHRDHAGARVENGLRVSPA